MYVGLVSEKKQYNRSVARLVAESYLPPPDQQHFDTPIHLDGNLDHCWLENLEWRPRWFANKYTWQFCQEFDEHPPIRDKKTGVIYKNIWNVVSLKGLLYIDVVRAINECTYVFPTMDLFEWAI